jgi:hypothetical protein
MKFARILVVCVSMAAMPQAWAQKWEVGGGVGGGFFPSVDVTNGSRSASAKIQTNLIGSAWLSNNGLGKWGGELRYDYQVGDLQLSQGGTQASFAARSQSVHYDILWHFTSTEATVRPFVAVGGGVRFYNGTGNEVVFQPLSNFALLTKDQDLTALASVGAGIKVKIAPRLQLRVELHDYITPFPKQVITPNVGSKVGAILQDIVPSAGLGYLF